MTAATATTRLSAGTWAIDPVHSSIAFSVRHLVVSKVRGNFSTFSGAVVVAEDGTPSVTAEIAVDSVDTGNEQRDAHLKSADFFDVEQYPTATFVSTGVRADGDDYVLDGDFTLKGVTKPVSLDLEFNGDQPRHGPRRGRRLHGVGRAEPQGLRHRHRHAAGDRRRRRRRQGHHHPGDRSAQAGLTLPADRMPRERAQNVR